MRKNNLLGDNQHPSVLLIERLVRMNEAVNPVYADITLEEYDNLPLWKKGESGHLVSTDKNGNRELIRYQDYADEGLTSYLENRKNGSGNMSDQQIQSNNAVNDTTNGFLVGAGIGAALGGGVSGVYVGNGTYDKEMDEFLKREYPDEKKRAENSKFFKSKKGKAGAIASFMGIGATSLGTLGMGIDALNGGFGD